jgi:DNA processing protein
MTSPKQTPHTPELAPETRLEWAQLAFLSNGSDPLLFLLAKILEPAELLEAVGIIRRADSTSPAAQDRAARSRLRQALGLAVENYAIDLSQNVYQQLDKHIDMWTARLRDLGDTSTERLWELLTQKGRYDLLVPAEQAWPLSLNDLLLRSSSAPPLCLWIEGNCAAVTHAQATVGIVGSREADDYGRRCAHDMATHLISQGVSVFSGGATGIDASSHWGALSANPFHACEESSASTVAIFAGGLHHIGPSRNLRLFDEIVAQGGALVSELPPDTIPHAARFLERNRLIAALSDCIVVAQARYRSGAINTAQWANTLGRSVVAIPGPIDSPSNAGCNRLIADQKATILTALDDVTQFLPFSLLPEQNPALVSEESEEKDPKSLENRILAALRKHRGLSREQLTEILPEVSATQISQSLGILEITSQIAVTQGGLLTCQKH